MLCFPLQVVVLLKLLQSEVDLVVRWWTHATKTLQWNVSVYSCIATKQLHQLYDTICIHTMKYLPIGYCMCVRGIQNLIFVRVRIWQLDFGLLPTSLFFSLLSSSCIIKFGEMKVVQ